MRRRDLITALGGSAAFWPLRAAAQGLTNPDAFADLIISGGTILTQNPSQPRAQALASKGEYIIAVGAADDVAAYRGPQTRLIDLGGRRIIKKKIDAHAHLEREGLKSQRISLQGLRSIGEILNAIRAAAARAPKGEWIATMPVGDPPFYFGGPDVLAEHRMPTRYELDGAAPDNPVWISGSFNNWGEPPGYTALNSLALLKNGVTAATVPTCPGITIIKDANGEPTGVIVETNDRPMVEFDILPAVPRFSWQQRLEGIRASMKLYNAVGTTGIYEGHGSSPQTLELYRTLWEWGELNVRASLVVSPSWTNSAQAMRDLRDLLPYASGQGFGDHWLRVSGVFIGLGGNTAFRNVSLAAMPDTGWSGFLEYANTPNEYRDYVMTAAELGFRVHTIGSGNLDKVLAVWDEADQRFGIKNQRWVLEHVEVINAAQLELIKKLNVHVTTIPSKALWKRGPKSGAKGEGAGERVTPHRSFVEQGIPISVGTDNVPYSQLFSLWNVTSRESRSGEIVGPLQRMTVEEALPILTREGARLSFDEQRRGILRAGMLADVALLDRDLLSTPLGEIKDVRARITVVGGRIVHET